MFIVWAYFYFLFGYTNCVFGAVIIQEARVESSPPPTPTPISSNDVPSQETQILRPEPQEVNAQFITLIEFATETVIGPCEPTPVAISYAKRDAGTDAWVEVYHENDMTRDMQFSERSTEIQERQLRRAGFVEEFCSLMVKNSMPPCSTFTHTSTITLPPFACPTASNPSGENCIPTDPAYKILIFDDYFTKGTVDPGSPIVSPHESGPPADKFIYNNVIFHNNFNFVHCEADGMPLNDPRTNTCNRFTMDGSYFLSLESPPSPAPAKSPVKRSITFEGRYFHLHSMLISAYPLSRGINGGAGIVSVIIKGYTSDVGTNGAGKPAFIDVRYIRGGVGGGGESRLKISYELNFFHLVRLDFIAVEGEWKVGDGEDWSGSKWRGKGTALYIDDLAICRYF